MKGTEIDYSRLAMELLAQSATTKAVSSTPTTTYGHGPGGLLSPLGMSRPVFNAMVLPTLGLQDALPWRPSQDVNPLYGLITGVTATTGSEPEGVCDDPPTAGLAKLCTHSFVFGRMSRQTRVFDIDRAGKRINRGEFFDLQLVGNPLGSDQAPTMPSGQGALSQVLNSEAGKAIFELAVAWKRDFAKELYTGNPSNNNAGGRTYFYGLDYLINTGYRDAITGQACAAADSIVASFGNNQVSDNPGQLISTLTGMYRRLKYLSVRTGLDPAKWSITMPWSLFYTITEVWPCAYYTYRCSLTGTNATQFVDTAEQIKLRDDMRGNYYDRTGQYLLIDGERVPVILDDAITETEVGSGVFGASIYFVPMTVLGSTPVTYMEYFDYDAPNGAMEMARMMAPADSFYTSDGGRFLWHRKPPTNFCVQALVKSEPRLILLTPFLAARLTNVRWTTMDHERSPFADSAYFVNGGRTDFVGFGPSYYSPTA